MANGRSLPPHHDDFTRALLRSADADEPSSAAYAKVAAAVGVGVAVGASASIPVPAAAVAGVSGVAHWSGSLAAKLALLGVSGALLIGAVGTFVHHRLTASASRAGASLVVGARAAQPVVAASGVESARARVSAEPAATVGSTRLHAAPVALLTPPARVSARVSRLAPQALHTSSLPEQVQSLDRARIALSSADPGAALAEIAHYRQAWPNGVFLTEASVLEIEALAKRGDGAQAAARAKAFVEAHPDSPQADRLRSLIPADQP